MSKRRKDRRRAGRKARTRNPRQSPTDSSQPKTVDPGDTKPTSESLTVQTPEPAAADRLLPAAPSSISANENQTWHRIWHGLIALNATAVIMMAILQFSLASRQTDLSAEQTDLSSQQTELTAHQNRISTEQTKISKQQNALIARQNSLLNSQLKVGGLQAEITSILDEVNDFLKASESARNKDPASAAAKKKPRGKRTASVRIGSRVANEGPLGHRGAKPLNLPQRLKGRIIAASLGMRPYSPMTDDGILSARRLSPERGRFLVALLAYPIVRGDWFRRIRFEAADLEGIDLNREDLSGIDLRRANLKNADLHAADLRRTKFEGADLTGATLDIARVSQADWISKSGCTLDADRWKVVETKNKYGVSEYRLMRAKTPKPNARPR